MEQKVHYHKSHVNGHPLCNQDGRRGGCSTVIKNVTCRKCLNAYRKGKRTPLAEQKEHYGKKRARLKELQVQALAVGVSEAQLKEALRLKKELKKVRAS